MAQLRDLENARARLEEQLQFSQKQVSLMDAQLLEMEAMKKQAWETERALDVTNAQLAVYKERERALSTQLEMERKETNTLEMNLMAAQSTIEEQTTAITNQRETIFGL